MKEMSWAPLFMVGSVEGGKVIFDRVYLELSEATKYCDSRINDRCDWEVYQAPIGGGWIEWKRVYVSPRRSAEGQSSGGQR
jgi:hypothetical protein